MGEKAIIRLGDRTSHGGTVVEGHQFLIIHGKPAAGVGHRVHCPKCAGSPVIVEGVMTATMMGIKIAVEGMKTSCGATLIASQITDTISVGYGSESAAIPTRAQKVVATAATTTSHVTTSTDAKVANNFTFDDHYVLIDANTGEALANIEYAIDRASGAIEHGVSDSEGKTHMLSSTVEAEEIDIYV